MTRVIVHLTIEEWRALRQSAAHNIRDVREQARYLIVKGLADELAALVTDATPATTPEVEAAHAQP
jgi:hypothetical protein